MRLFPNAQDLSQTNAGALGVVSGNVAGNPPYLAGNHRKHARFEIYAKRGLRLCEGVFRELTGLRELTPSQTR